MASSFQKPTAEQVRSQYREQFHAADLGEPTIVEKIDDDGLIHSSKLNAPLKVEIPLWDERPPGPPLVNVLILECQFSISDEWLPVGNPENISDPTTLPDSEFPLEREIPVDMFRDYEGKFYFRYRVKNWNSETFRGSPEVPVTIDRTGPVWKDPLSAVIDIVEPVITDVILARDKGVFCIIPDFDETPKTDVWTYVAWMDRVPLPGEDITSFIRLSVLTPADRKVLVPASAVTDLGSKTQYAVAILVDKAGNRSELSLPATVQVALGTLPADLKACTVPLAADGVVDRADAAMPTKVHIEAFTGYHANDGILVKWGTKNLSRTSVGAHLPFPLTITVPWSHMAGEYDFASSTHVQSVDVTYSVLRGDYPFPPPSGIKVNTDFAIPGPVNPNPEPNNPALKLIAFESFSGSSTELTLSDIGKDATATIELYDDPEKDEVITLYYNGDVVTASNNPYVVDGTESPNAEIEFIIPWADIERTPVMDDLPMYYTVTHPGFANPQHSDPTTIDVLVEVVDLPKPEFPVADFPTGYVNCDTLKLKQGTSEYGIFVHIPMSAYLKEGVDIKLEWQSYEYNSSVIIAGTDYKETVTASSEHEANGLQWFVPYIKCLKPTYLPPHGAGTGTVEYTINVRGTDVPSGPTSVIVAVFESSGSGNDHCMIPRP